MEEMVILGMLLCVGLAVVGLRMRMWPIAFISSIGWIVIAMRIFEDSQDFLILGLMVMVAITQIILVKSEE